MRIALIHHVVDASKMSGMLRYTLKLFFGLKKLSHTTDLLMVYPYKIFHPEVPTFAKLMRGLRYPLLWRFDDALHLMPRMIRKRKYDITHVTSHLLPIGEFLRFIEPIIVTIHDVLPITFMPDYSKAIRDEFKRSIRLLSAVARVITVSNYTKSEILKLSNISSHKIKVIYEGVDHKVFRPRKRIIGLEKFGLPKDKKVIAYVGNEEPRKNMGTLFKAISDVSRHIRVMLIRNGSPTRRCFHLIRDYGLENSVIYLNVKSDLDLALLYNTADIFVYPSLYEGFGIPLVEAMASGIPIVASNKTSIPEIIADAGCYLNDPLDADELSQKIMKVLVDKDLKLELIRRGLKRARIFSWNRMVKETLHLFEKILGGNNINE